MTDRNVHADFPSDETLAAFIDGRLDPEMRRRVVEHIATCPECYDVVLAANAMRAEDEPRKVLPFRKSRYGLIALVAAAVAFAAFFVEPIRERIMPRPKSGLAALAAVAPPQRNIEGRLSGFPYRPLKPVTRGGEDEDTSAEHIKLLAVAAQVAQDAARDPSIEKLHARGVASLLRGKPDEAIAQLESALTRLTPARDVASAIERSTNWKLLTDLSAAYIARGDQQGRPIDFVAAAEAAERAWSLERTPETAWNRAVAIERLHVGGERLAAWQAYLDLDATSAWAAEARKHLQRSRENTWSIWSREQKDIDRAANQGELDRYQSVLQSVPQQARSFAEDQLLVRWADAVLSSDQAGAAAHLASLASIGSALTNANADFFVADVAASVRQLQDQDRVDFAQAVRSLSTARKLQGAQRGAEAVAMLSGVIAQFSRLRSPLVERATIVLATTDFYIGRFDDAETVLRPLIADLAARGLTERHASIWAPAHWTTGLVQASRGYGYEALQSYRVAQQGFDHLREAENAAFMRLLIGESLSILGSEESWRYFMEGSELIREAGSPSRIPIVYAAVARAALRSGYVRVANIFAEAALRASTDRPAYLIDGLIVRAECEYRLRNENVALRSIGEAKRLAASLPDEAIRARAVADLEIATYRIFDGQGSPTNPALDSTIALFLERRDEYRLANLSLMRASARARGGDFGSALADYDRGFAAVTVSAQQFGDAERRRVWMQVTRPLIDGALNSAIAAGDHALAFVWGEKLRATISGNGTMHTTPEISRALGSGVVVLSYWVTAHETFVWCIARDGVNFSRLPLTAEDIRTLKANLATSDATAFHHAAAVAYDRLLAPLDRLLDRRTLVVVVPDEMLTDIPWGALYDGRRRRCLIESMDVAAAPSASLLARATAATFGNAAGGLLVADPAFDAADFPELSRLAGAATESAAIADAFPFRETLRGRAATVIALRNRARAATLLHFAGHAVANKERPNFSGLVLAPAVAGEQSILYARDIDAEHFGHLDLVFLSACATASGGPTSDFSPLATAFVRAGVPFVVGTTRPIPDADNAAFTRAFYASLQSGGDPVHALCEAQRRMLRSDALNLSWSAFEVLVAVTPREGGKT